MSDKQLIKIGLDSEGNVVASKFACTKQGCNCVGSWVSGNERDVEEWEDVED